MINGGVGAINGAMDIKNNKPSEKHILSQRVVTKIPSGDEKINDNRCEAFIAAEGSKRSM
jgi:hypothetical protein